MSEKKCEKDNPMNELNELLQESPMIMIMGLKSCIQKIEELEKKVLVLEKDSFEMKTQLKYHPDFKK